MCLVAVAWSASPRFRLVVAANRDEWRARPTAPADAWPEHPELLAGRDLAAGGTWMGVTRAGRFAAVTNFRDPSEVRAGAASRGTLVLDALLGPDAPAAFLERLAARASAYHGFNLLLGDATSLLCLGSRDGRLRAVEPGVHALSNHLLDEPWPKVRRARAAMTRALAAADPFVPLLEMLSDREGAPDAELPDTGVGLDWERRLAPPLIVGADYGTRSSTVLTITHDGAVRFEEHTRGPDGEVTGVAARQIAGVYDP